MAWKQKRGGVWWVGYRMNGKEYRFTTRSTKEGDADAQIAKIEAMESAKRIGVLTEDYFALLTGKGQQRTGVVDFLERWLKESTANTTVQTVTKYKQVVSEFIAYTKAQERELQVADVTPEDVRGFLLHKRQSVSAVTVAGFRRILRSIFLQAQEEGKIRTNPVPSANRKANRREISSAGTRKRVFTLDEIQTLHRLADPFWNYMVILGFYSGQRMGDLITLRRDNVDNAAGLLRILTRKTGKTVKVPIHPRAREALETVPNKSGSGYFWPDQAKRYLETGASSFSQEFHELMARAGIVEPRDEKKKGAGKGRAAAREESKVGFHALRHTFISLLKITGATQATAKELVGHTTDRISDLYTHVPEAELSRSINQLPEFGK